MDGDFLKGVGYKIIVKVPKPKEKLESGIYLPDSKAQQIADHCTKAVVLQVPADSYRGDMAVKEAWCKVGDTVLIPPYAGRYVRTSDKCDYDIRIVRDNDIDAVVLDDSYLGEY